MNLPGFTADASLYDARTSVLRMATSPAPASNGSVQMAAKKIDRGAARFCNAMANWCLDGCDPYDNDCRFGCNDGFFTCYDALTNLTLYIPE